MCIFLLFSRTLEKKPKSDVTNTNCTANTIESIYDVVSEDHVYTNDATCPPLSVVVGAKNEAACIDPIYQNGSYTIGSDIDAGNVNIYSYITVENIRSFEAYWNDDTDAVQTGSGYDGAYSDIGKATQLKFALAEYETAEPVRRAVKVRPSVDVYEVAEAVRGDSEDESTLDPYLATGIVRRSATERPAVSIYDMNKAVRGEANKESIIDIKDVEEFAKNAYEGNLEFEFEEAVCRSGKWNYELVEPVVRVSEDDHRIMFENALYG